MSAPPRVSIVLATHNRREVLRRTLDQIAQLGLGLREYEVIVVDNASEDGTADVVAGRQGVRLCRLDENLGSCAKAVGVEVARGEFVLFLDDDSYPRPGCVERMLSHFAEDPRLGATGFTVHLRDGSQECSALPHAFVGCGAGLRARALREVGGLDRTFFMQAEEYDLSWRLLGASWKVETFADLQVEHGKSLVARRSERTTYHDVRNNLRLIARYLPQPAARIYREDWLARYGWLAERAGHTQAFARGAADGERAARNERREYRAWRLSAAVFEQVFGWRQVAQRMRELARAGVRRVVLADLGKNMYAFHRGARAAGLHVLAIADDRVGAAGRRYRGVPVCSTAEALARRAEAVVVSNTSYVHAERRRRELADVSGCPVHGWFSSPAAGVHAGRCRPPVAATAAR